MSKPTISSLLATIAIAGPTDCRQGLYKTLVGHARGRGYVTIIDHTVTLTPDGEAYLEANPTVEFVEHVLDAAVTPVYLVGGEAYSTLTEATGRPLAPVTLASQYVTRVRAILMRAVTPAGPARTLCRNRGWLTSKNVVTLEGLEVLCQPPLVNIEAASYIVGAAVTPAWECLGVVSVKLSDFIKGAT